MNPRKVALVNQPLERLREGLRVDRLTVLLAEEEVSIPVAVSPFLLFGELALAVKPDLLDCGRIEVDDPGQVVLWCRHDEFVSDRDERLPNMDSAAVEIQVGPTEAKNLASTHPSHRRDVPSGLEPMPGNEVEERAQLLGRPEQKLFGGSRSRSGRH